MPGTAQVTGDLRIQRGCPVLTELSVCPKKRDVGAKEDPRVTPGAGSFQLGVAGTWRTGCLSSWQRGGQQGSSQADRRGPLNVKGRELMGPGGWRKSHLKSETCDLPQVPQLGSSSLRIWTQIPLVASHLSQNSWTRKPYDLEGRRI